MKTIQISILSQSVKMSYKVAEDQIQNELQALQNRCNGSVNIPVVIGQPDGFTSIPASFFRDFEVKITVK